MSSWERIENRIDKQRKTLLSHHLYQNIDDIKSVRTFMESHVFAVWDFMSLLKVLQRDICCTSIPWSPPVNPSLARMINEIVLAEESDINEQGDYASHFDLYRSAMIQAGANVEPVDHFIASIRAGRSLTTAMNHDGIPEGAKRFVEQTFKVINSGHLPSIAAAFTFGREDLLPDVFSQIITGIEKTTNADFSEFIYYLDRHVSLDGDEHGPMAKKLVMTLCGDNEQDWQRAEETVVNCLQSRIDLWDSMNAGISAEVQQV